MKRNAICFIVAVCILGTASCKKPESEQPGTQQEIQKKPTVEQDNSEIAAYNSETAEDNSETAEDNSEIAEDAGIQRTRIEEQTFEAEMNPLGKITFVSYQPDAAAEPQGDVRFVIEQDGQPLFELERMTDKPDGAREGEAFVQVQAVSFPDYNGDGYEDIITICTYQPDEGEPYDEVRIYEGSAEGVFVLQRELSWEAGEALAEKSISGVLGFLGAGRAENQAGEPVTGTGDTWQKAYIENIESKRGKQMNEGYALIYLDDDEIPELVEIGTCEAAGCRVVHYHDGAAYEAQLSRLNFTYIEKSGLLCNSDGHMDFYYDIVYSLEDGILAPIATGLWGWLDESVYGQFDESENPLYVYEWNGVRMEQAEYENELNSVYDTSKMQQGYVWDEWYTEDEMIELLQKM